MSAIEVQFSNYVPQHPDLRAPISEGMVEEVENEDGDEVEGVREPKVSSGILSELEEELEKLEGERRSDKRDEISKLAPLAVDWDLKRDLQPKLEVLEKETHNKLVGIMREKLMEESSSSEEEEESEEEDES